MPKRNWRINKYFYANGKLHKVIQQNRGLDSVVAWCYEDRCRYRFSRAELREKAGKAYTIAQAAELLNRHKMYIHILMNKGVLKRPQRSYSLDGNFTPSKYFMCQDDVLEMHDYFANTHVGRPRHDELITSRAMPSKAEIMAMMRNETAMYVKEGGDFIPVWKHDW